MKRGARLRRRFKLVKSYFDKMFKRRDSAVVIDDTADAVAQHRAETEAMLEGKIEPLIPTSQKNNAAPRRRNSYAVRESNGARDSVRQSRLSFVEQHFVMSAMTAGFGQGLSWSMSDAHATEQDEPYVASRKSMFHEDGHDNHSRSFFARSTKRKSKFRYSMLDPSMGLGESADQHDTDVVHFEQANYIRAMMESGNFDIQQLGLNKESINDPDFQTALHAALESFPPGMAAQVIEAAGLQHETQEEAERPVSTLKKKARFSISVAGKTAWHDIRSASNRWSRASWNRSPEINLYEKPRFSRRVWSRMSWGKKRSNYMAY